MKFMKKREVVIVSLAIIMVIALFFALGKNIFSGKAIERGMCVDFQVSSINPSSVDADEDFTVGIQLENCGEEIPDIVTLEITRKSEDISVKEPLVTEIGKLNYANSKRFVTYNMHSSPDASPGIHNFDVKITYGKDDFFLEKRDNFSIIVNSYNPDLTISRIATDPEIVEENERITLTIDVENSGRGEAKDVRVELLDLDFEGVKQKYLGEIGVDESIPARFILESKKSGMKNAQIKITYKQSGEDKELIFPMQLQVFEKNNFYYWIIGIILILAILAYLFFRKKSQKTK